MTEQIAAFELARETRRLDLVYRITGVGRYLDDVFQPEYVHVNTVNGKMIHTDVTGPRIRKDGSGGAQVTRWIMRPSQAPEWVQAIIADAVGRAIRLEAHEDRGPSRTESGKDVL